MHDSLDLGIRMLSATYQLRVSSTPYFFVDIIGHKPLDSFMLLASCDKATGKCLKTST